MNTTERRPSSQNGQTRKRKKQDVVYTQAKAFNRKRFVLQLATVAAVVLALLFGMSIFFKVEQVQISGTVKYDPMQIKEVSGVSEGDSLLLLNKNRIIANIRENPDCAYIDTIQIGRKLPGTVVIAVTELDVFYTAQDQKGSWWLISSAGKVVDTCAAAEAEDHTRILGVQLVDPAIGSQAKAYEPTPEANEDGVTKPVTVYAQEKLAMAMTVIQEIENISKRENGGANRLLGKITVVDVTDPGNIELAYGTRFQMLLGDQNDLIRKINALNQVLGTMEEYASGILDASFRTWPNEVGHTDFPTT